MDNLLVPALQNAYGPYLYSALWLVALLALALLAALCVRSAIRKTSGHSPVIPAMTAVLLLVLAMILWHQTRMDLWQGALGLLFSASLVYGKMPRRRYRRSRRAAPRY